MPLEDLAIDRSDANDLSFIHNTLRRESNAGLLCKMSFEKGNERSQEHKNEKWETGYSRCMPHMWDQDVQNWKSLGSVVIVRIIEGAGYFHISPFIIVVAHSDVLYRLGNNCPEC